MGRLSFFLAILLSPGFLGYAQQEPLLYIENGGTRAGILSDVGGRIVYLSYRGSDNLLKSDPGLWNEDNDKRPVIGPEAGWKAYNGHVVWVGPQSEWWIHQDLNEQRKQKRAVWPPDPYLVYGQYEILEKTRSSLIISGPESKISGLKLTKKIRIEDDGSLYFEVEAVNTRRVAVEWDLWLNTRVNGYTLAYVKVDSSNDVRIKSRSSKKSDSVRWAICEDYFYYLPEPPPKGKEQRSSKAFITPANYRIHAFSDKYCLSLILPEVRPEEVHPEQGIVEIYDYTSENPENALMELEFHAPYKLLQPGELMKTWQKWKISRYRGRDNPDAHIKYLKKQEN